MGGVGSSLYNGCRRLILRYNVESRAEKHVEKGKLAPAPRHPLPKHISGDIVLSEEQLKELHGKNEQLTEYLKKVYLTSTSKVIGTPSKRPKPKKENELLKVVMFYEPQRPKPGTCTLSNAIEMLLKFQQNPEMWNASILARNFNLNKTDVVHLTTYYSLFTIEKFDFMKADPKNDDDEKEEPEKIVFEVYDKLNKKPLKKIKAE